VSGVFLDDLLGWEVAVSSCERLELEAASSVIRRTIALFWPSGTAERFAPSPADRSNDSYLVRARDNAVGRIISFATARGV
jgi:hypothetical protein